jgi:hypothetical protein
MTDEKAPQTEQKALAERLAEEKALAEHELALARLRLERAKTEEEVAQLGRPLPAEEAAAQEAALAKLRLERATLERDLAKLARPWWRSWNVTALGAFLAAIAPATAGVTGYFERSKQFDLAAAKQTHDDAMAQQKQDEDIRGRYLDRIDDPHQMRRTLRLIVATSKDEKLRQWALDEFPYVDRQAQLMDEHHAALLKKADEDEAQLLAAIKGKQSPELIHHMTQKAAASKEAAGLPNHKDAAIPSIKDWEQGDLVSNPIWQHFDGGT